MWGRYDRVVLTNSLSKAYGLPGLRLGWLAGPPEFVNECWSRHDYTTIGPGSMSDQLAIKALQEPTRSRILKRTRELLGKNLQIAMSWVDQLDALQTIRPNGGAYLMLAYDHDINSCDLAEQLRVQKSVLIVPGEHFGMDGWMRVGFGEDTDLLQRGLQRIQEHLRAI